MSTSTAAAPTVKDQELVSFEAVVSAKVDSISDFIPLKSHESTVGSETANNDFVNTFICHLIFYMLFCVSLALHILIDLGLGDFIKNKFSQLISLGKQAVNENIPAFA
tara:strand:+ start:144 stop:467 length:324 start_codon:yes stop_codon:yes gene_type:complete